MRATQWATVAHILILAVWLGTDVATFTLSRRVVDPAAQPAVRLALAKAMTSVEIFARLSLPSMLATGVFIAQRIGYLDAASAVGWLALVGGLCWVGLVWTIHRTGQQGIGGTLTKVDLAIRSVVCAGLWVLAAWSWIDVPDGPLATRWLAAKVGLLAAIVTCGIAIRFTLRPFSAAFGAIVTDGSTPAHEATLQGSIRRAQPLVVVIWTCLVAATAMAVLQPALGQ